MWLPAANSKVPGDGSLSLGSKRCYLEFVSAIEDPHNGRKKLNKLSQQLHHEVRSYPGFNFFDTADKTPCSPSPAENSTSPEGAWDFIPRKKERVSRGLQARASAIPLLLETSTTVGS